MGAGNAYNTIQFPPNPSSSGKRYYAIVTERLGPIGVYCGFQRVRSAFRCHATPTTYYGYPDLEAAVGRIKQTGRTEVVVYL